MAIATLRPCARPAPAWLGRSRSRATIQIAAASVRPKMPMTTDAPRQPWVDTRNAVGAWPNTPPAMPKAWVPPARAAKRWGMNQWTATVSAPTQLNAAPAPTISRPR